MRKSRGLRTGILYTRGKDEDIMDVNGNSYVAGKGTTALGIIGTALGGLNSVSGNNGLGGLFGNGSRLTEAEAKIAKLEAERYTDAAVIEAQKRNAAADAVIAALTEQVKDNTAKHEIELAAIRKEFAMQAEIDRQSAKINLLETVGPMKAQIDANSAAIGALGQTVSGFTKVYIPASSVVGKTA